MNKTPFVDRACADELAEARARRQRKVITAIMAHPSYRAAGPQGETTRGQPC
jgi:L-asparaginase II